MSSWKNYAEEIKKSLNEADLEFEGENKEYEHLWLDGYGALKEAIDDLPEEREKYSKDKRFFLLLMKQAMVGLNDMYLSLRRRRYTAVRRDMRFVYEAILLLDKSIDDPEWASMIQESFQEEASEHEKDSTGIEHSAKETTQKISNMASKLHGKITDEEDAMKEFSQLLGVSGSHPYNFEGMYRNGKKNEKSEQPYLEYGLNFSYGLIGLFLMKFNGDWVSEEKFTELMDISREQLRLNDDETFIFIWYFSDFAEEIDT